MFIIPSVPNVQYRGNNLNNWPINISLVTWFSKGKHAEYPDNVGIPTIYFAGIKIKWVFETEYDRDEEFNRIISLTSIIIS